MPNNKIFQVISVHCVPDTVLCDNLIFKTILWRFILYILQNDWGTENLNDIPAPKKEHKAVVLKVWIPEQQQHHWEYVEMQILGSSSRPAELETQTIGPYNMCLTG